MVTAAHDDSMIKNLSPRTVHDASLHDEPPRKASGLRNRLAGPRNDGKPRQPAEAPTDGSRAGEDHSAAARDPRRGPSSCARPCRRCLSWHPPGFLVDSLVNLRRASIGMISPRRRRAPDGPTRAAAAREPEESREELRDSLKGLGDGLSSTALLESVASSPAALSAAAPCADDPVAPLTSCDDEAPALPAAAAPSSDRSPDSGESAKARVVDLAAPSPQPRVDINDLLLSRHKKAAALQYQYAPRPEHDDEWGQFVAF